ncbi:MAG: hypothetical protein ACREOO_10015 [bacterium]
MIKLNFRWMVQALALILSIASFTKIFNSSKTLLLGFAGEKLLPFLFWAILFLFAFFLLMFTSYLKQRANFTLRNRVGSFEKLIHALHLENYKERDGVSEARQLKRTQRPAP